MKALLTILCFFLLMSSCFRPPEKRVGVKIEGADSVRLEKPKSGDDWSSTLFDRAKRESKFVILDLQAVWCHWCHVMEETTYKDPVVLSLLQSHFILARVDQDSRPDLSNLYEDYGWPATIVFNADRGEIIKRSGYIPPKEMASLLKAIVADPRPGPSVLPQEKINYSSEGRLSEVLRKELQEKDLSSYDSKQRGWGSIHKYIDPNNLEYSLLLARAGDSSAEQRARETLKAALGLMDPAWGGAYQYSTHGDWKHPHFEKIMSVQADDLRVYALAYLLWKDPIHRKAAEEIHGYLENFLKSPEGAFYTSQDADLVKGENGGDYFALSDIERRKKGIPAVDHHIYSRENGWVIEALANFYGATGETRYLDNAKTAAEWVMRHRSLPKGGYAHGDSDVSGPYLGDALAMGRAFFALYSVTGDRVWLAHAQDCARFIDANFRNTEEGLPGFLSSKGSDKDLLLKPAPEREENIQLALWANRLFHSTGDKFYRGLADEAMRYLATPEVALKGYASGILLADRELGKNPAHVTVVGHKEDPLAGELFSAALRLPLLYRRIEWWDKKEGPLPNPDVQYPELATAVAFVCTEGRCSSPIRRPEEMAERVNRLNPSP